jgi:hypothetical protein
LSKEEEEGVGFWKTGRAIMKEDKDTELDCSKNCKFVVSACEAEGRNRNECENRYNDCVSKCTFA